LSGIFNVEIAPAYSEGAASAFKRLKDEVDKLEICVRDIRNTDPRHDKHRIKDTKGGLLADSYRWVLDNTAFQQWRQEPDSRLLWVKGDPSKGKTMFLCGIINELQSLMLPSALLSYFFYQATNARINSATAVLQGLLYMLVTQQPSLACMKASLLGGTQITRCEAGAEAIDAGFPPLESYSPQRKMRIIRGVTGRRIVLGQSFRKWSLWACWRC
jgi:hypothetical protein